MKAALRPTWSAALVLGMALWAHPTSAQTLAVQTGDHADFTRLVIPIGAEREWTLSQTDAEAWSVTLSPEVDGFDLAGAFELIQRNRLAALSDEGELVLSLACPCEVTATRFNERFLVIDISDPVATETAEATPTPVQRPLDDTPNTPAPQVETPERAAERAQAAAVLPDLARLLTGRTTPAAPVLPAEEPTAPTASAPDSAIAPNAPAEISPEPALPQASPDQPNPRIAEAAAIMAEQLARAAASGLLDAALDQPLSVADPLSADDFPNPSPTEPIAAPASVENAPVPRPTGSAPPEPAPPTPTPFPDGPLPIRTENPFDISWDLTSLGGAPPQQGACRAQQLEPADWAENLDFHAGLGALRLALYDDRDQLVPEAANALAQYYLHFGFGAEARYWLDQISAPNDDLVQIAALVDGAETADFPAVETLTECSDGELLWRYVGQATAVALDGDATAAIQRSFGRLPAHLRDQIGPRLARLLHQDGFAGTARNIRDTLHRGARLDATSLRLLDLDLGIQPDTTTEATRQALAEALRDDGANPTALMASALAFDREAGLIPSPDRLVAAEGLLREAGTGPETDRLWQETLIGRAALGQIDAAIAHLSNPLRSESARTEALTALIAERVAVGDTAALLIMAYQFGPAWRPEGSQAGRAQIQAIASLREAGLMQAADILRDTRQPLILPATEIPETVADTAQTAWETGDWPGLADIAAGPHQEIAARLAELGPEPVPAEPPQNLQGLADQVADSRELRASITALLSNPALE